MMGMVRALTIIGITAICACASRPVRMSGTVSIGTTDDGYLHRAAALPDRGEGYRRLRPGEPTRHGTPTLIAAIERAARSVAEAFPGGYPLLVGDLSSARGGAHDRHRSHRSGRDADLAFFVRDIAGIATRAPAWLPFDRYGLATRGGRTFAFDEARNWQLVRTLVMDPRARVKWLFCSAEIKSRLLRYAARHEPSSRAVVRATWVLHQPSRGDPHTDHFHLRVGCGAAERTLGCRERAPFWPWLDDAASKDEDAAQVAAMDGQLVRWLLVEEDSDQSSHIARRGVGVAAQPTAIARRDID